MNFTKLMLLTFVINLLLGFSTSAYNYSTYNNDITASQVEFYENVTKGFTDDSVSGVQKTSANYITDNSIGNSLSMGKIIWDTGKSTFNPLPISPNQAQNTLEEIFIYILMIFKTGSLIIYAIAFYDMWKNRNSGN